ncbi:Queuine tRNA-ribosyltransferase [compost metagenome]
MYSRAYLRHLTISKEMLAAQIATLHNLSFYIRLVTEARERISSGTFAAWKTEIVKKLERRI